MPGLHRKGCSICTYKWGAKLCLLDDWMYWDGHRFLQLVSSTTKAEPHGRKSKCSQTRGSHSLISLSPALSELCCQCFNGVLPGKGPVPAGELVISKRQRDTSFRLLPTIWTAETRSWGWAGAQRCKTSDGWQLGCTVPSSLGVKVIPALCWGSWGAGEPASWGEPRAEAAAARPERPKAWASSSKRSVSLVQRPNKAASVEFSHCGYNWWKSLGGELGCSLAVTWLTGFF